MRQLKIIFLASCLAVSHGVWAAENTPLATAAEAKGKTDRTSVLTAGIDTSVLTLKAEHEQFVKAVREKEVEIEKLSEKLDAASALTSSRDPKGLSEGYALSSAIWESAVNHILSLFSDVPLQSETNLPELVALQAFSSDEEQSRYKQYLHSHQEAKKLFQQFALERNQRLDKLKAKTFNLLSEAGTIRADLLQACDHHAGCDRPRGFNANNLKDTWRETRAVPLRIEAGLLTKSLEVKAKANSGLDGWMNLIFQLFVLLVIIATPFILKRIFLWLAHQLDGVRRKLLARSMLDPWHRTRLALLISRLNPFVPSIGMILSVHVAQALLETTDLKVLAALLTYLLIYFYYQAAQVLLGIILEVAFTTSSVNRLKTQRKKIEGSAKRIAGVIFLEYAILQLIEDTVRTGLIYNLFSDLIFWFNLGFVIFEARRWREAIWEAFAYRYAGLWKRIEPLHKTWISHAITPILFIADILHDGYRFVSSRLVKLDFMKQLLSEIFKRRLDQAGKEAKHRIEPPEDYLSAFDYYLPATDDFFIVRDESVIIDTKAIVSAWLEGDSTDDLVVIIGDRGIGKTTVLQKMYDAHLPAEKILSQVPARTLDASQLYAWLSESIGKPVHNLDELMLFDSALTSKLTIFIDEIHNLFISKVGGFEAYREFIQIINLQTKNIFWCLTCNARSWAYLKGVFGDEHFYGKVLNIRPWHDYEIQRLILARHELTQYRRTFDESISAYAGGDGLGQQAETQFFRLLWGQSRGNPRSALMYWQSAISSPDPKHIHVGIPAFVNSNLVSTMSDDALFLLASIARHENLSISEMEQTTEIDSHIIRRNLKEAFDKQLIWFDPEGRVRISSRAQYVIDYFLIGKNFLHE